MFAALAALLGAGGAGWGLLDALSASRGLVLTSVPLRGAAIQGRARARSTGGQPAPLFDELGELQLAGLVVPGYDPPELRADRSPLGPERLPEPIAALDGREVRVCGFPLPLESGPAGARAVLLSLNPPGCCFGLRPVLDEWILVRSAGAAWVDLDPALPATFSGRLEVGELLDEDGHALSLYRMPGARLVP